MAEFTCKELRIERDKRDIKRWQVAEALGVSTDTIGRWESGEAKPEPDDIDKLEKLYNSPGMWHKWMMSHYDSYRERYSDAPDVEHLSAVIASVKFELNDVLDINDDMERDALDGKIDNEAMKQKYLKEISEGMAALQKAREVISGN